MITLASVGSASSAAEYYSADNYYTADQTQDASSWFGEGAEVLGLSGKVEEAAFVAVLEPLLIVAMGALVLFMVLAILLTKVRVVRG